jgi:RNA polymerase sigma-70 factor (ECF subfamily)
VEGDLSAADFWARYRGELGPVCGFLGKLGVRSSEIEDIAHDVFVVAFERRGRFDAARPIRPWLFGIAFRVARGRGRRAYRLHELAGELPEVADAAPTPDEAAADREARGILHRALAELDEDQRAVFVLHDLEQQSMPAIAELLEVPLNTAYSRLRLARKKLNERFSASRESP